MTAVRDSGTFIGFVGLAEPRFEAPFTPCVEIGWRLRRDAWGHGYATEAAEAVLAHGFETLHLPEIVSFTTVANEPSQAVMRRLGMHHDPADDFDHPSVPQRAIRSGPTCSTGSPPRSGGRVVLQRH